MSDPGPKPYTTEDLVGQVRIFLQMENEKLPVDKCMEWAQAMSAYETDLPYYLNFAMVVWRTDHNHLLWEQRRRQET